MEKTSQLWSDSGESCPEGTVPIRRTTEKDILRASSLKRFGRKLSKNVRRDSSGSDHEVSILKQRTLFPSVHSFSQGGDAFSYWF